MADDGPRPPGVVTLERSKSVQMDSPYGLGNLLLPVMLFYHPSMKSLAEKIASEVERRKQEDTEISVIRTDKHRSHNYYCFKRWPMHNGHNYCIMHNYCVGSYIYIKLGQVSGWRPLLIL